MENIRKYVPWTKTETFFSFLISLVKNIFLESANEQWSVKKEIKNVNYKLFSNIDGNKLLTYWARCQYIKIKIGIDYFIKYNH